MTGLSSPGLSKTKSTYQQLIKIAASRLFFLMALLVVLGGLCSEQANAQAGQAQFPSSADSGLPTPLAALPSISSPSAGDVSGPEESFAKRNDWFGLQGWFSSWAPESQQISDSPKNSGEWLEWIANKSKKSSFSSGKSSSGTSWWTGSKSGSKVTSPMTRSYSINNKTTYQRMSLSAKRMWNRTAEFLDPFPEPKSKSVVQTQKSSKSWWSSMSEGWGGKEAKRSQSVSEFIGQDIPR